MTDRPHVVQAVRSGHFAGVERYVSDVTTELVDRGWPVTVVGGDPGRMRRMLPDGVRHVPATSTAAVARALVRLRPELVHSHMTAADVASCATKPLTRAAVISTRHFAAMRGSRTERRLLLGVALRAIDVRVAISEFVRSGTPDERVVLNGVRKRDLVRMSDRRPELLVMQRLESEKDTGTALQAWARSRLPSAGWELVLAGRGSLRGALEMEAAELGICTSVRFAGFVEDPDVLIGRCGALLATAPAEPFGLTVAEAMATGAPVVAAEGGGHTETLGEIGWTFPPGDVVACAALLDRLLDRDDALAGYGRALQARQRELLSLDRHVDELTACYREALALRGAAP